VEWKKTYSTCNSTCFFIHIWNLPLHIVKDYVKHHFIHPFVRSFICPSIRSSICLIMVCLLRQGEERMEYKRGVAEKAIGNIVKERTSWIIISSICFVIHLSIHPVIHSSHHGLFTPIGWERVEYRCGTTIGRDGTHAKALQWRDRWMKWCFTSVWSSICLVMVLLFRRGEKRVEYTYIYTSEGNSWHFTWPPERRVFSLRTSFQVRLEV